MTVTGPTRRINNLGRIAAPVEPRRSLCMVPVLTILLSAFAVASCSSSGKSGKPSNTSESTSPPVSSVSAWSRDKVVTEFESVVNEDNDLRDCEGQQSRPMCARLNSVEISQLKTHAQEIVTQLDSLDQQVANNRSETLQNIETEMRSNLTRLTTSVEAIAPACGSSYDSPDCATALDEFHNQLAATQGTIVNLRSEIENSDF